MLRRSLLLGTGLYVPGLLRAAEIAPLPGYPDRPIEFTVAFPAGGGMDVTARILARQAERLSGARVFINNRVGGAGMVAHSWLARQAPADGHAVGILSSGIFLDSLLRARGAWTHEDVTPIAFINYDPTNWITASNGPLAGLDLAAIIARAREAPESIRIAMLPESSSQFIIEQVEQATGARFLRVPFQGGIPGMTAMLGGHIDIATVFFSEYRTQLQAGAVRAVAVAGAEPTPNQPTVPTFNSATGRDDILWAAWRFAVVPKATPPDRIAWLTALLRAAADSPEAVAEFTQAGVLLDASLRDGARFRDAVARVIAAQRGFLQASGRLPA